LELSPTKHAYLCLMGRFLKLVIKAFKVESSGCENNGQGTNTSSALRSDQTLTSTWDYVVMDKQQAANFLYALPDLVATARRREMCQVSGFYANLMLKVVLCLVLRMSMSILQFHSTELFFFKRARLKT